MKDVTVHTNLNSLEDEGLLEAGVQRDMTDEELAKYAEAAPELAPVFDAIIGNHDLDPSPEELGMEEIRRAGW